MDSVDVSAGYSRCVALGRATLVAGRFEEAVRLFGEAVVLWPDEAAVHVELAAALRGLGRVEMARRSYARALTVDPSPIARDGS